MNNGDPNMDKIFRWSRDLQLLGCIGTKTYEHLKEFGKFGESFDDLFNRMMNELEDCRKLRSKK